MSNTINSRLAGLVAGVLAVLLVIVMLAPAVSATGHIDIVIPVTTIVRGDEGDVVELAHEDVPEALQGQTCTVEAVSQNQDSVHADNDLLVASGETAVLLEDVEAVPLGTVEGSGELVLGSVVVVFLKLGPDGVFSAGINVEIDCTPPVPPETTTTSEATTTTTEPESTTTTTIPDEVSPTSIVSSTTTIVSTTAPEVSPTDETLPFTGNESGTPAALALVLIAGGALALVGSRSFGADTDE